MRKLLICLLLGLCANAQGQVYNHYGPANGIQKGSTSTYQNTSAAAADVIALWSGCLTTNFLRGDGACAQVNLSTNVTGTLPAGNLPAITGDVAIAAGSGVSVIQPASVTLADQANLAANSIPCNNTSSAATQIACNPLQVDILSSVTLVARVVSTSNITLSGTQVIDSVTVAIGNTVLVAKQTTSSQDGLYIVQSGAWTRAPSFPSGFVIPAACPILVQIIQGNVDGGSAFRLNNSAAITIGTTNQTWLLVSAPNATTTTPGTVSVTAAGGTVVSSFLGGVTVAKDCVSFQDTAGSTTDSGNAAGTTGPCLIGDLPTGHPVLNDLGTQPTVSSGTLDAGASDEGGVISGLIASTSVTLTFAGKWELPGTTTARPAHCVASDNAASVVGVTPNANGLSVVFSMAALTGSLSYICL